LLTKLSKERTFINGLEAAGIPGIDLEKYQCSGNLSDIDPEKLFNGHSLRLLRRSLGMSQVELSDLLGVTQPNISRWEAGSEKTPARMSAQIREVMFVEKLDPSEHLVRLARSDPDITITYLNQYSLPIVQLSRYEAGMLSKNPSEYIGKDYLRVFRTEWFDEIFQNQSLANYAQVNVHHDLQPDEPDSRIPVMRAHSSLCVLHPENGTSVVIAKARYSAVAGAPCRIGHAVTNEELFNRD
jgi:transcriptional regulator with XRE-family HTH domain